MTDRGPESVPATRPDSTPPLPDEAWLRLLPRDVRPWLLASDEPAARWLTLTALLDRPADDPEVVAAHAAVLADDGTRALLARLPDGLEPTPASSHASPAFAPNLLILLADLGLRAGDDAGIERLLDALLECQDPDGRFATLGRAPGRDAPEWGALPCDTHIVAEVLLRFGRGGDARVTRALRCVEADLTATAQGLGWRCRPDPRVGWRGPGRVRDVCPQATVEALRVLAHVDPRTRPAGTLAAVRTLLHVWRSRGRERPYQFGHGERFKTVMWPPTWYGALAVVEVLGCHRGAWRGASAAPEDRRAAAELAACLLAYNVGPDGTVTPRSCRRGFEAFSFGQKRTPSAYATARVLVALRRVARLAPAIHEVDVPRLPSSKGGTGTARPPRALAAEAGTPAPGHKLASAAAAADT